MKFQRVVPCPYCRKGREEMLMVYFGPVGVPTDANEVERFSEMEPQKQQVYASGTMHRWVCTNCQQKMDLMITQEMIDRPEPSQVRPDLQPSPPSPEVASEETENPLDIMRQAYDDD